MTRNKIVAGKELVNDIDLEIRVRSSRVKLPELLQLTALIAETVKASREIQLVEQTTNSNRNADRVLFTVTSKFQSPD